MQHAELNGRYTTATSLTSITRILPSTVLELNQQMNNADYFNRSGKKDWLTGQADSDLFDKANIRRGILRDRGTRRQQHIVWNVTGGKPITEPIAVALRRVVFGQCPAPIRSEFFSRGPPLIFRQAERDLGYGLSIGSVIVAPNLRSIIMTIQAHIICALLFDAKPKRSYKPNPLTPSSAMQQEALCTAISDIIWRAGDGHSGYFCLPNSTQTHVSDSDHFNCDGVTEKLHIFECSKREDLHQLCRRYLEIFQQDPSPSLLLILYSTILTRGIDRVTEDMRSGLLKEPISLSLLSYSGDVNFSLISLLLTGRASPYLHNGTEYRPKDDHTTVEATGVTIRSPIGLLIWMRTEEKTATYSLGSRLKTPVFPVWLVVASEQCGVLFSDDRELLRDYRSEIRFQLHYYSSTLLQSTPAILIIRTRMTDNSETPEESLHILDKVIRTKWNGARITWNGLAPFI